MCGICGFTGPGDAALLRAMAGSLSHRGPDDEGFYTDDGISMANRRLSIIDLPGGRQPISNEDRSIWTVFNGEIYNFFELRRELEKIGHRFTTNSDTEVIVHGYEAWGDRLMERFRGMFAFAVWDMDRRRLLLVRDRVGIKPLYYTRVEGNLLFSSELKSLLLHPGVPRTPDPAAIRRFLELRYIPGPRTILQGVHKLPPGHYMVAVGGDVEVRPYWQPPAGTREWREAELVERILHTLEEAVRLRLIADVPIGLFLSGGLDSSTVAAVARKHYREAVLKSFSVGFGVPGIDELAAAREMAGAIGTEHHEVVVGPESLQRLPEILWHMDEPVSDPSAIPVYLLSEETRRHVKVVLSGEGGDELFGGYFHHKVYATEARVRRALGWLPGHRRILSLLAQGAPRALLDRMFEYPASIGPEEKRRVARFLAQRDPEQRFLLATSPYTPEDLEEATPEGSPLRRREPIAGLRGEGPELPRVMRFEFQAWLPAFILEKSDKMTMAHGLELRVPLLDHRLAELAFTIPLGYKLRGGESKYVLRRAMQRLLPPAVRQRPKHPYYTPIDTWYAQGLRDIYTRVLLSPEARRRGLFRPEYVEKCMQRHSSSPLVYSRQLWSMLLVELWHRVYVDREKVERPSRLDAMV